MIVKTATSIYEVREDEKRFRRVDDPKDRVWRRFDRMGPIELRQPLRFFSLNETSGSAARFDVWATSAVEAVVPGDRRPRRARRGHGRLAS